jgi:hypothetical protein
VRPVSGLEPKFRGNRFQISNFAFNINLRRYASDQLAGNEFMARGSIENQSLDRRDFESTNRVCASVCAFTVKASHAGLPDLGRLLVLNDLGAWSGGWRRRP